MITTHVLDTARGRPAAGIPVALERRGAPGVWEPVGRGETDGDGRLRSLGREADVAAPGIYRLVFDTRRYFEGQNVQSFYPEVVVIFETTAGEPHYHVPLLLGPYGYTTYRGS